MKRIRYFLLPGLLLVWATGPMLYGQQKLAQTGMKFLNVGTDPRPTSMAGAVTATEGFASSMFYNPAGMARIEYPVNLSFGYTMWIADINHSWGAVAFRPFQGDYGVAGLMFQWVDYGDFYGTVRANNAEGFIETGMFKPTALAIGVGYARALSDKFSVGGNVKFVRQSLGSAVTARNATTGALTSVDNTAEVVAFDFGVLYRTGFKSLNFGMTVRNFSREIRFVDENFQLPLTFKIGLSMNILDFMAVSKEEQAFLLTLDAEHPRDFQEQIRIGGEYTLINVFSLRAGYVSGTDEEGISFGVGHRKNTEDFGIGFDYCYTPFGIFGNVHRIGVQFAF